MSSGGPMRQKDTLADVVEMLLDKGIVVNADIIVTIGETELLGVHLRAAIASFETAAEYGLEFPDGTDTERIDEITGRGRELETIEATGGEPDVIDEDDETAGMTVRAPIAVPDDEGDPVADEGEDENEEADADGETAEATAETESEGSDS